MKKLLFALIPILFSLSLIAQEDPAKALKKATRALGSYNLDQSANAAKLDEAVEYIDIAYGSESTHGNIKMWQTRGEIYNAVAQKDVGMMVTDQNYEPKNPDAGLMAAAAFIKKIDMSEKKYEFKDAHTGLAESGRHLNVIGNYQIQVEKYEAAYKYFDQILTIHDILTKAGEESPIQAADYNNQRFLTAFCAKIGGNEARAKEIFKELYDEEVDDPSIYAQYFQLLEGENEEEALKVLQKGRERYPNNSEILFAEINYYIAKEKYEALVDKLKKAIETEPENASVRSALGNVYMNLYNNEFSKSPEEFVRNGDSERAKEFYAGAIKYFNEAIEQDAKSWDAIYSIGSMYFNRAVENYKVMGNLTMSKEDQKLYERFEEESKELMSKALPYFKNAESINPNDQNTLLALSEIFARTQDFENSKGIKERLEQVKGGTQFDSSYFN